VSRLLKHSLDSSKESTECQVSSDQLCYVSDFAHEREDSSALRPAGQQSPTGSIESLKRPDH